MAATTSTKSWNDCSTFEQMQRNFLKMEVGVVFWSSGPLSSCALTVVCVFCSQLFLFGFLLPSYHVMDSLHPLLPHQVLTTTSSTTCGILCWKCFFSSGFVVFSPPISWKSLLQGRGACLCTMIHWAPQPMEFLVFPWHHCHLCVVVFGASLPISVSHFSFLLEQFPLVCFRIHVWHW